MKRRQVSCPFGAGLLGIFLLAGVATAGEGVCRVHDDASLRNGLRQARPGTRIVIAPGRYAPGVWVEKLSGTAERPIVVEGADPDDPPRFEGGSEGWHLSDCNHLVLRNLVVRRQKHNGINVDDGGSFDTPAKNIVLEDLRIEDVGPQGNFDGIKLSGVDDFVVRRATVEGWGGQAIDMVGCHRGTIEQCVFRGKAGFSGHTGPQTKGGSSEVTLRNCLFDRAGERAVQAGGSTAPAAFRPQGARYEAKNIVVERCVFVGGVVPIAFTGVDGAAFRSNTIYRPEKWVARILQETSLPGFVACRNGRFERNLVVFRRSEVQTFVNVGPNVRADTFVFRDNLWYCEDRPSASRPQLPVEETGGLYGVDPKVAGERFEPREGRAARYGAGAR